MEQLIKKFTIYNLQFTKNKGVTRGGGPHGRGPVLASRWKGRGAAERQDPLMGGQLIVEFLVAFGLVSVLIPVIIFGFISGSSGRAQQEQRLKATGLLEEGEEAARSLRNADWVNVATNGTYYPKVSGSAWVWGSAADGQIGDFTRTVTISDLIPLDPSKKKITVTVSWSNVLPVSMTSSFILSRWKNISSSLTASGTLVNQGNGDWCAPSLSLHIDPLNPDRDGLDLPKNGVANAISAFQFGSNVQIAGGTGDNASGVSYANVQVTDPASPATPSASIAGTFDGFKTNDVFTEQNYAYLATDTNSKEVEIIDLTNISGGKYAEAGYFNAPGNGNAMSVATSGNIGYAIDGTRLYDFDLTSKSGSRPVIDADGLNLPGTGNKMIIFGQRAYITTTSTSAQLVVVDISNSSNLTIKRQFSLDGQGGKAVYLNQTGTRAYVATGQSASQKELFTVNIDETTPGWLTLPSSSLVTASYDTNGMDPKGVIVIQNFPRAIVVGTGAEEYQVLRTIDEATGNETLSHCGGLQIDTGVNGVATVFTAAQRAYSYIITGDSTTELKIIEGGPGGGGSGGGLTVESPMLDAGHTSTFNRISITDLTPGVSATYQVAVSTDCSTFNYTGNYTSAGGQIPLGINPGQCFKYKVTFSGPPGPVSTTVSVNYSP